ncbi:hypothetical protein NLI96_g4937 [Meripilus lineatus]|uniref:F-box domain-containing protein n=1 Tax=Meripilus lineatus TaxID=2056292 RepID=A0AAD5V8T3_9APHY|nr:hypothetical protein NLI96_g4937 [Physisporinus lineatus]
MPQGRSDCHLYWSSRPRLPLELQEQVIRSLSPSDYWPDTDTLSNCATTCRDWYRVAIECLYNPIEIVGKSRFQLFNDTLRTNKEYASKVHTLSLHDVTPAERVSHVAFHSLPRRLTQLEYLIIFGPCGAKNASLPMHPSLFVTLSQFHSILAAFASLESAILRNVSWQKTDTTQIRPLFNGTAWRLRELSLSGCPSDFVASVFWAPPPPGSLRKERLRRFVTDSGCHPPVCVLDAAPLMKLAELILNPTEPLVGSICWEWKYSDSTSAWSLECGIDEINSLGSRNYARFHFSGPQSISGEFPSASGQNESRITSIGIYYDEQSGLSMDGLDILLSDFQFLKHLDLNFVRPTPNYSVQMVVDQLPNVVKTNIQVRINGSSCSMRISEKPLAPSGRSIGTTCCGHIKNKIGTYFLLNTVFYDFDISLKLRLQEEAVRARQQVVNVIKEFSRMDPLKYNSILAELLHSTSIDLSALNHHEEAYKSAVEAVGITRDLIKQDSVKYNPNLAACLHSTSRYLSNLGRSEEAIVYDQEALEIRRDLLRSADDASSSHDRLELAASLTDVGITFRKMGKCQEAVKYEKEALEIKQEFMRKDEAAYGPMYASSLNEIAWNLAVLGQFAEALPLIQESVDFIRSLEQVETGRFTHDLACYLDTLSVVLTGINEFEAACAASQESLMKVRILREANQSAYKPLYAELLRNFAVPLSALDQTGLALKAVEEALSIHRGLAQGSRMHSYELIKSLDVYSDVLRKAGRDQEAVEAKKEARKLREEYEKSRAQVVPLGDTATQATE